MIFVIVLLNFLRLQYVSSTSNNSFIFSYSIGAVNESCRYQNSLTNLLETLASQTKKHGFYNFTSTSPKTPDQLHGLYLCRGDVDPQACQSCVTSARNDMLKNFRYGRAGLAWYDHCMIRYSNESFYGKWDENMMSSSWDNGIVKGVSLIKFMRILRHTINCLAIKASNGQNVMKFASKVVKFSMFQSLYATVQCTPDLNASDCYRCLANANKRFLGMRGSTKGRVLYSSCMAEYKTVSVFPSNKVKPLSMLNSPEETNSTLVKLRVQVTTIPVDNLNPSWANNDSPIIGFKVRMENSPISNKTMNSSSTSSSWASAKFTVIRLNGTHHDAHRSE